MTSTINPTGSQTISLPERVKQNLEDHKWQILVPGPVGLAALAMTVVFLVSNPFGWAFSAGLVGAGIAIASLNAVSAIGYSLYYLLKEPRQIKNLYTDETLSTDRLVATIREHFKKKEEAKAAQSLPAPQAPVASPSFEKPATKKDSHRKKKETILPQKATPLPDNSNTVQAKSSMGKLGKSALVLSGLLLAGYGFYTHYSTLSAAAGAAYQALEDAPFLPTPRTVFYYMILPSLISRAVNAIAGPPRCPPDDSSLPRNGTTDL